MLRTQVQFTEEQHRRLRAFARQRGVSVAEAVRISVGQLLDGEAPDRRELFARAAALIGTMEDREGATDLALHHDAYLDGAFR